MSEKKRQGTLSGFVTVKKPKTAGSTSRKPFISPLLKRDPVIQKASSVSSRALSGVSARSFDDSINGSRTISSSSTINRTTGSITGRTNYNRSGEYSTTVMSKVLSGVTTINNKQNRFDESYSEKINLNVNNNDDDEIEITGIKKVIIPGVSQPKTESNLVEMFHQMDSLTKRKPNLAKSVSQVPKNKYSATASKTDSDKIELSDEQMKVYKYIVNDQKNVFFTGSAGTGKSILLKEIIKGLLSRYNEDLVGICASTGLAAVNVGGQTLHKFSGIGTGAGHVEQLIARLNKNQIAKRRWQVLKILIIDEISMIDSTLFEKLHRIAKHFRQNDLPFGGIQLVLTGDFFQLPPINKAAQVKYCFQSPIWQKCINKTILLTKVFRQKGDNKLIEMLNTIRLGKTTPEINQEFLKLSRDIQYDDNILPTELYPTRNEVNYSNTIRLNNLPGKEIIFEASDTHSSTNENVIIEENKMLENLLCVKRLILKEDAQVILIKNLTDKLANGTVGIVLFFASEELLLAIARNYDDIKSNLQEIRFVTSCIGSDLRDSDTKEQFLRYNETKRKELLPLIRMASRSNRSSAFPVVQFKTSNDTDEYSIQLVQPEEFIVNTMKPGSLSSSQISRTQVPLLLSWALSIHKSQGQTLNQVKVDLNKIFEKGQVYVALSRATSKERLQVLNFTPSKIKASPAVINFYNKLEKSI